MKNNLIALRTAPLALLGAISLLVAWQIHFSPADFAAPPATNPAAASAPVMPRPTLPAEAMPPGIDVIGPDDLLEIGVADLEAPDVETPKTVRVDTQGNVSLFLVGSIPLAGLHFADAERLITQRYINAAVIPKPHVSLNRLERGAMASVHAGPLGSDDLVRIEVLNLSGRANAQANATVRILRISDGGNVGVPFIGQVRLAGLSESDAEVAIDTAFKTAEMPMRVASVLRLRAAIPMPIPPPPTVQSPWSTPESGGRAPKAPQRK